MTLAFASDSGVSRLRAALIRAVLPCAPGPAALLCSGGVDSVSVGLALQASRIPFVAYTFAVVGRPSPDHSSARYVCRTLDWPHVCGDVSPSTLLSDLVSLAQVYGCRTPSEFMVTWPFLHLLRLVRESVVVSGHGADVLYGLGARAQRAWHVQAGPQAFNRYRADLDASNANGVSQLQALCAAQGKALVCPYLDPAVIAWFLPWPYQALHTPYQKAPTLAAFAQDFARVGRRDHADLQVVSGIRDLFQTLLDSPLNTRGRRSVRALLSDICQEVTA